MRLLFEGGHYSRAASIGRNTVALCKELCRHLLSANPFPEVVLF